MTNTDQIWQRLDRMLELYRAYQDKMLKQQEMIVFLHERNAFEPGRPGGMDASADDLINLIELAEETISLNNRWMSYGESKLGLDVKPRKKDRSHLSVVHSHR